ncbi:MAG: NAD(P)/FAD-dependent oxidoreductase [Pseudomonadales bacterium]|nr:NAD(P)/FAD-dependent oxidoreductase [Pseudomonadales bacterium]
MKSKHKLITDHQLSEVRKKYQAERIKRLRSDGINQFNLGTEEFKKFIGDPNAAATEIRPPLNDEVEVVIIGGGFGGLLTAASLYQQGIDDFCIIEEGSDVGGTWYWNRFPGAQCDVESYIYMPLLEELGYMPSEKYASGQEIFAYCQHIAKSYGVYNNACFETSVTELRWHQDKKRWRVSTDKNDSILCRFVCTSSGILNRPKLPNIKGVENFSGHAFHTSRWDYQYTGGSPSDPMKLLAEKKVAIVGTGATAIQCIPKVANDAKHLYVFQRTPSSIDVRNNQPTDENWVKSLKKGWQQKRIENFNAVVSGKDVVENMVQDGWSSAIEMMKDQIARVGMPDSEASLDLLNEEVDCYKMSQLRRRIDQNVNDEKVAEALKPWYRQWCKRPCFHDEYLSTYNRDNVTLVDTQGNGIEKIEQGNIIANNQKFSVDCIIFATGFDFFPDIKRRLQCKIIGLNNKELSEEWQHGVRSLFGMHSQDFPNCFILGNHQSTATINFTHSLHEQAKHIAHVIHHAKNNNFDVINVEQQAEQDWVNKILSQSSPLQAIFSECTPGFYNNEGHQEELIPQNGSIADTTEFFSILKDWREEGEFRGLLFS